jgi:hypothetical protein
MKVQRKVPGLELFERVLGALGHCRRRVLK